MKNREDWRPTKFVRAGSRWRASRDPGEVFVGSRIVADLMCAAYEGALAAHARGAFLDLGCGKAPLHGIYGPLAAEVTCADWPGSLHGSAHVDRFVDVNEPLPFADASFDTVLMSDLIEHVWNHDLLWAEVARILRPGGTAVIGTPFMYWLHEEPHDYFRWTPHALDRWARANGLEVVSTVRVGGAPEVLADVASKVLGVCLPRVAPLAVALMARLLRTRVSRAVSRRMGAMPLSLVQVVRRPG